MSMKEACPCGGGLRASCCGPFLDGGARPATAETLMRSRYSAYVLSRALYLCDSWHPRTRPVSIDLDDRATWLGLSALSHEQVDDTHATVEFVARFRERGAVKKLHELSRFETLRDRWLYVDGDLIDLGPANRRVDRVALRPGGIEGST